MSNKTDMNTKIQFHERAILALRCEIVGLRKQLKEARQLAAERWMLLHRFELYRHSRFFLRRWLAAAVERLVYGRIPEDLKAVYSADKPPRLHVENKDD